MHRMTRLRPWSCLLAGTVLLVGCGGDDDSASTTRPDSMGDAGTSQPADATVVTPGDATTTIVPVTALTPAPTTTGAPSVDDAAASLGGDLCRIIEEVQASFPNGAEPIGYRSQVIIAFASETDVDAEALAQLSSGGLDGPVAAACPETYATFLEQAGIESLRFLDS